MIAALATAAAVLCAATPKRNGLIGGYPSIVELPAAGCSQLDVRTGGLEGSLVVKAVEP